MGREPALPPRCRRSIAAGEASPKGSPLDTTVLARRTERIGEERFDEYLRESGGRSGRFSRSGTGGDRNRRNGRPSGRDILHQRMRREGCPFSRIDLKPGREARDGEGVFNLAPRAGRGGAGGARDGEGQWCAAEADGCSPKDGELRDVTNRRVEVRTAFAPSPLSASLRSAPDLRAPR